MLIDTKELIEYVLTKAKKNKDLEQKDFLKTYHIVNSKSGKMHSAQVVEVTTCENNSTNRVVFNDRSFKQNDDNNLFFTQAKYALILANYYKKNNSFFALYDKDFYELLVDIVAKEIK